MPFKLKNVFFINLDFQSQAVAGGKNVVYHVETDSLSFFLK
jgi:hypothetical protein